MRKRKGDVDHERIAKLLKSGRRGAPKGAPDPGVKLDLDKIAKGLGAERRGKIRSNPADPTQAAALLDEVRNLRRKR